MKKRPASEENPAPTDSKRRKHNCETYNGGSSRTPLAVDEYTVGWVCALHIEMAAAKSMLDDVHDNPGKSPNDSNTYILGSLHHHNVVIACLPTDGYGTNSAATVASNMRRTFPSIQIFLMVGIGGGVPGKVDIRLGDVVVSTGVLQYDLGKTIQQGHFQPTATKRQPSTALLTAVSALRALHELESSAIPIILTQMRDRYPAMAQYADCELLQDLLFNDTYDHAVLTQSCDDCDKSKLVDRSPRNSNSPVIHYGIIASGNQVIKHAETRDQLAQRFNAICFEMEAAGLMDSLQCLVIRGICDYSDSHKSKQWQKYASATAAAYAKELLSVIPTIRAEATPTGEAVPERRRLLMDSLSFEKIDARHSNIKSAYGKTCAWLLDHPNYRLWRTPAEFAEHHGLLWIHGKPGAGKSTIMKFIYTHALENSRASEAGNTIISFFFNARGDDLEKSTQGMYRSLLLQVLQKLPDLQVVLDPLSHYGQDHNDDSSWEVDVLQSLFSAAIAKLGRRRITCFVDALDECSESQVRDMVEYFEQLGESALGTEGKLYICFSSRHYPTICIQNGLTLTLEDQSGHSQDLEKYVRSKLKAGKGKAVESVRTELLQKAAGVFMWVVLVVNILNEEFNRGRMFAVKKRLQETPAELSELFKDILRRDNKNMPDLLLSIQWILYAKRPMKPEELYYAVVAGLDPTRENLARWDPEQITADDMSRFVCSSSKGLAEITKSKARTVQFIHESVRDFLLKDGGIQELWPDLGTNFQSLSHDQLKKCCYEYLQTTILNRNIKNQELPKASSDEAKDLRQQASQEFPFLEYATHQVFYHANFAAIDLPQHDFVNSFDLGAWIHMHNLFAKFGTRRRQLTTSLSYILAENGFARLLDGIPWHDTQVSHPQERHVYPRFAALANNHREAVKALLPLQNGLAISDSIIAKLAYGRGFATERGETPLLWAVRNGHLEIVLLVIEKGVNIEAIDNQLLYRAVENGHLEIVRLLLERGANIEATDDQQWTPLRRAVENGHLEIVRLLLERGANIEATVDQQWTPLRRAVENGHLEIVRLLLENIANTKAADHQQQKLLCQAVENEHLEIVQLLLERGANVNAADNQQRTPLYRAIENGYPEIVQLLIEKGANIELEDSSGWTPLLQAVISGRLEIVRLLIERGANIKSKDNSGCTPLLQAVKSGRLKIIRLLIKKGANIEWKDNSGQTLLLRAVKSGHLEIVWLLIEQGANIESKDSSGWTPLIQAAYSGHLEIVRLLAEKGANVELTDSNGHSPLWWAKYNSHQEVVQLLVRNGANDRSIDGFL